MTQSTLRRHLSRNTVLQRYFFFKRKHNFSILKFPSPLLASTKHNSQPQEEFRQFEFQEMFTIKLGQFFQKKTVCRNTCSAFFYKHSNEQGDSYLTENETLVLNNIRSEVEQCNPFLRSLRQALEMHQEVPLYRLVVSDVQPVNASTRTCNVPTSSEVAAIIVGCGDSNESPNNREVGIRTAWRWAFTSNTHFL